jgi:hypothetical protein
MRELSARRLLTLLRGEAPWPVCQQEIDCSITFHYCEWETSYYAQNNSTCRQLRSLVTCKLGTRTIYPSFQIFCRQASLVPQQNCFWWITSDQGCSGIPTCNGLIFSPKDSLGSNFERFGHNCVDGETNHFVFLPFLLCLTGISLLVFRYFLLRDPSGNYAWEGVSRNSPEHLRDVYNSTRVSRSWDRWSPKMKQELKLCLRLSLIISKDAQHTNIWSCIEWALAYPFLRSDKCSSLL